MSDHDAHDDHPAEVTLLDYVVGSLGPDSSDDIRRHVESCASCRDRIVNLAMDMDEIDRLPMIAIPHDLIRSAFSPRFDHIGYRRGTRRLVPILLLLAAAIGVIVLFQVGGMRSTGDAVGQRQIILQTNSADPVTAVDQLLGGIPHTVVVDRADARHLVVLVGDADVAVASSRLTAPSAGGGLDYVIDLGGTGRPPDTTG